VSDAFRAAGEVRSICRSDSVLTTAVRRLGTLGRRRLVDGGRDHRLTAGEVGPVGGRQTVRAAAVASLGAVALTAGVVGTEGRVHAVRTAAVRRRTACDCTSQRSNCSLLFTTGLGEEMYGV